MHAIARGALSHLRFAFERCESPPKTSENVSSLKRWGSGILRIQSPRFKDENRRVCRYQKASLLTCYVQMIDLYRLPSDSPLGHARCNWFVVFGAYN